MNKKETTKATDLPKLQLKMGSLEFKIDLSNGAKPPDAFKIIAIH